MVQLYHFCHLWYNSEDSWFGCCCCWYYLSLKQGRNHSNPNEFELIRLDWNGMNLYRMVVDDDDDDGGGWHCLCVSVYVMDLPWMYSALSCLNSVSVGTKFWFLFFVLYHLHIFMNTTPHHTPSSSFIIPHRCWRCHHNSGDYWLRWILISISFCFLFSIYTFFSISMHRLVGCSPFSNVFYTCTRFPLTRAQRKQQQQQQHTK